MNGSRHARAPHRLPVCLGTLLLLASCAEAPVRPELPPSASDLLLMKSATLCDRKPRLIQAWQGRPIQREAWGSGEEIRIPRGQSDSSGDESYFFDQDGLLVGALFQFPAGLDLEPYSVLRQTLAELKPVVELYLNVPAVTKRENLDASALYETGTETTTTRYLILGDPDSASLLAASFAIDPYAALLNVYRKQFLSRLVSVKKDTGGKPTAVPGYEDKEPFIALQQFARGETAQLGYCGTRDSAIAADGYSRALVRGFTDPSRSAEAHHKLGLAYVGQGKLEPAKGELQQALKLQPKRADVLNNLGDVYRQLGDHEQARAAFERAVTLRPNYPVARFNLAQEYEGVNPKLALTEYETYLALAVGIPEEGGRIAQARERMKALKR